MSRQIERLLCIDLQVDPALGLEPDTRALFGARQLLGAARRKGWAVAHMRRRRNSLERMKAPTTSVLRTVDDLRPLPSEPVLLRDQRSLASVGSLEDFLHEWRHETVYVATFDRMALLSCLLACHGAGPRFTLVDEAIAKATATDGRAAGEGFTGAVRDLAGGLTSLSTMFGAAPPKETDPPAPFQPDAAA